MYRERPETFPALWWVIRVAPTKAEKLSAKPSVPGPELGLLTPALQVRYTEAGGKGRHKSRLLPEAKGLWLGSDWGQDLQ